MQEKRVLMPFSVVSSPVIVDQSSSSSTSTPSTMSTAMLDNLPTVVDELASLVAVNGDQVEAMVREKNAVDEEEQLLLIFIRLFLTILIIIDT